MKISFKLVSLLIALTVLISACGGAQKSETSAGAPPSGKTLEYDGFPWRRRRH